MVDNNNTYIFEDGPPPKHYLLFILSFIPLLSAFPPVKWLIKRLLRHCENCDFITGFQCYYGNIYAKNAFLGNSVFFDYAPVYIGEGSQLGYENMIITSTHDREKWSRIVAKPVYIGKNVWITSRCIILAGVTIGDNSIIGAGSVVTRDIPENVFAAGNPCRVIKSLDDPSDN